MKVPFFQFDCSDLEIQYVTEVVRSGWLTTASKAAEFEGRFRDLCNTDHALAVNSCTAGLHLALEALGVTAGDKVIVPSLTFTASAEVIRYLGADPVFVDCEFDTGLMDPETLRETLRSHPNVKACVVVHFAGQSANMSGDHGIVDICRQQGVRVVVDAAHAFPASDEYGPVGSIGDVTCFSFYANKTITTGEGGMVVTNDEEIAKRIKVMRLHGIDRDIWDRFTSNKVSWEYDVVAPGYKYNMPDVNAAIGLAQLERAEEFRQKRQNIAKKYISSFKEIDGLRLLRIRVSAEQHSWHLFPVIVCAATADRDEVIQKMTAAGIGVSVHYKPLHRMTYYKEMYNLKKENFPNTEAYWEGCLSLPIYPSMTEQQVEYVIDSLIKCISV